MIVQAAFSVLLAAAFLVAAVYNGLIFLAERRGGAAPSVIPVFGGILGAVGVWLWPYHDLAAWAWAPLLLDYGCAYYLARGAFVEARRAWRYREGNCFARLVGESGDKSVELRLYRGGGLQLEQTFNNPTRFGSFDSGGRWTPSDSGSGYLLRVWGASIAMEEQGGQWVVTQESGWRQDELRLAQIALRAAPQ
ncbi:MAG TPA: hypothetical protein VKA16_04025 [Burkholderiales bacterium]|nr:hypothetical protein [Burkholderiales bacterium]